MARFSGIQGDRASIFLAILALISYPNKLPVEGGIDRPQPVPHRRIRELKCATKVAVRWRGVHTNVRDAGAAGTVRPRGADGHRSSGRRLHGALPQVRDRRSGAGVLRRSATGAVGVGATPAQTVSCCAAPPSSATTLTTAGRSRYIYDVSLRCKEAEQQS